MSLSPYIIRVLLSQTSVEEDCESDAELVTSYKHNKMPKWCMAQPRETITVFYLESLSPALNHALPFWKKSTVKHYPPYGTLCFIRRIWRIACIVYLSMKYRALQIPSLSHLFFVLTQIWMSKRVILGFVSEEKRLDEWNVLYSRRTKIS